MDLFRDLKNYGLYFRENKSQQNFASNCMGFTILLKQYMPAKIIYLVPSLGRACGKEPSLSMQETGV